LSAGVRQVGCLLGCHHSVRCLTVPNTHTGMSFCIPAVPSVSSRTQSPRSSCPLVSSCVLLVPRMRDTTVTSGRHAHRRPCL
jgi:hypothetical protein